VAQNSLDNRRIFNAAVRRLDNDLDLPGAPFADLNIDPDAAQLNTRLSRCIQVKTLDLYVLILLFDL
jgi:hypothetical protein